MKRLMASLLILSALSGVASAKVAVIVDRARTQTLSLNNYSVPLLQNSIDLSRAYVTGFLDRMAPNLYDTYGIDQVKTEWGRTGFINGTQYTAVIWVGISNVSTAQNPHTNCYPCSLTLAARAPTVPQLFIDNGTAENNFSSSASCTTSYAGDANDPGGQGPQHASGIQLLTGTPFKWRTAWLTGARKGNTPAGTMRPILKASESRVPSTGNPNAYPVDYDSLMSDADIATAHGNAYEYSSFIVLRYMDHVSGAKPIIFCRWGQTAITMMGGSVSPDNEHNNGTPLPIWLSIALLDSLSSRAVLGANVTPIRFGIQISGLGARGTTIGILPHDTTNVFASLDSIRALRVPVTFGVNLDSAQTYLRDLRVASGNTLARFAPENRSGALATSSSGPSSRLLPRDLWGAQRTRSYVGPVNTTTADTSIKALGIASLWRIDSIFGEGRRSGIAMPPGGDWSPTGVTAQSAANRDSLVLAAQSAGFSGMSINVEDDTLTTSIGLPQAQRIEAARLNSGKPFAFIAFPGTLYGGTTKVYDDQGESWVQDYMTRVLRGSVMGFWKQPQDRRLYTSAAVQDDDQELIVSKLAVLNRPVNVARLSMCELGSGTSTTSPARPGFYLIKYLANYCSAVNLVAGRTLFQIVPVDNLSQKDLSR